MAYKHILIAVDLSPESKVLVDKAVSMARPYNAKVSLIHVDVNYSDLYTGLIDVNLGDHFWTTVLGDAHDQNAKQ